MSDVAELPRTEVVPAETGTDLSTAVAKEPGIVLLDRTKFNAWYEKLAADAPKDVDITTRKGRESLRSYAADIRSKKAAIDKDRLRLTEQWRDMVSQANAAGKEIKEQLEALAVEVRAPLTEWEDAEKAREAEVEKIIAMFRSERFVPMGEASDSIRERGTVIHNIAIDPDVFQDRAVEAEREKADTVAHLLAAMEQAIKTEKANEELERLRKAEAEREAAEQAKREAEEAEARRIEEEKRAEEARLAAEKAEQERIAAAAEQAKRDAEAKANEERKAAERKREYARQIIDHIKQVGLGMIGGQPQPYGVLLHELESKIEINDDLGDLQDEVRAIRDATHAQLTASMERAAAKAEQEEQADRDRQAEQERLARETDKANRAKVKTEAKQGLMSCGADEETAKKIVIAIIAGEIAHVRMAF